MSIILAIIILGLIIIVHEFGHFLMAKLFKVPVREFSVGLGPRIFSRVIRNTRYSLKAFPLGGSCAMIGEDVAGSGDFTEAEDVKVDEDGKIDFDGVKFTREEIENNNYSTISPVKKFLICLAGPMMNFVLAFLSAIVIVSLAGYDIPVVSDVTKNSPAELAKPYALMANDEIIALEMPNEKESIISYRDIALFMQLNNDDIIEKKYPLVVTFDRNGERLKTLLYPIYDEEYNRAKIGISFNNLQKKPKDIITTLDYAGREFYFYFKTTLMSLKYLARGRFTTKDISGPVGTVAIMGNVLNQAQSVSIINAVYVLFVLIAMISANLGIMNLLPIPALDGGRIVFAAIEMIIGRPIDKNIEGIANAVTMILLLILMIWILGMDIQKIFSGALY